ncbi:MAG: hypothetical protein K2L19_00635 [Eubacterium sp.]|nr:hypothetical protein [Eubacterium sp.]
MYDYDKIIDVLNEKSMKFTRQEILDMMNEELQKEPGEMDTGLVELCIDVLDSKYVCADDTEKESKKPCETTYAKRMRIRKALLVAAIFAVVLAITIPAGAKFVHIDATDSVVKYEMGHFSINLKNDSIETLIDDLVLPQMLIGNDCELSDLQEYEDGVIFNFKNPSLDIYGNSIIRNNSNETDFYSGKGEASEEFYSVEEINVNNVKALVIQSDDLNTIMYLTDGKEYTITIHNCDFETAKQIANTIGEK